jgi:hypothetical protein
MEGIDGGNIKERIKIIFMNIRKEQDEGDSTPEIRRLTTRSNRRRLGVLIVVVFVAILSFLAGRRFQSRPYVQGGSDLPAVSYDSAGVPPDSLHH